jgi:hypothetical protein
VVEGDGGNEASIIICRVFDCCGAVSPDHASDPKLDSADFIALVRLSRSVGTGIVIVEVTGTAAAIVVGGDDGGPKVTEEACIRFLFAFAYSDGRRKVIVVKCCCTGRKSVGDDIDDRGGRFNDEEVSEY